MSFQEVNIDGLVGPSHNYAGLGVGNLASIEHKGNRSCPRDAVLQGLEKMKLMHDMGIPQLIMPPAPRPCIDHASTLDLDSMSDTELGQRYSASSMWAANAATVSPAFSTADGIPHLTIANLYTNPHRRFEAAFNTRAFGQMLEATGVVVHGPLDSAYESADEGGANHMLLHNGSKEAVELYVYNYDPDLDNEQSRGRQSRCASETIAAQHGCRAVFAQQNPAAVRKGVFHNDVTAMSHGAYLIVHEEAFVNQKDVISELRDSVSFDMNIYEVKTGLLSVEDAVVTYFFNSQLVTDSSGALHMIMPDACRLHPAITDILLDWEAQSTVRTFRHYVNLHESMCNGGGPACLRLRMDLAESDLDQIHDGFRFAPSRYRDLKTWIARRYPDELHSCDLRRVGLADQMREIYLELDELLGTSLYEDQTCHTN